MVDISRQAINPANPRKQRKQKEPLKGSFLFSKLPVSLRTKHPPASSSEPNWQAGLINEVLEMCNYVYLLNILSFLSCPSSNSIPLYNLLEVVKTEAIYEHILGVLPKGSFFSPLKPTKVH